MSAAQCRVNLTVCLLSRSRPGTLFGGSSGRSQLGIMGRGTASWAVAGVLMSYPLAQFCLPNNLTVCLGQLISTLSWPPVHYYHICCVMTQAKKKLY